MWIVLLDPLAGGKSRLAAHVLTRRITGGEIEAQISQRSHCELVDVPQTACRRGGVRCLLDISEVFLHPMAKFSCLQSVMEHEYRRTLHAVVDQRGADAPCRR